MRTKRKREDGRLAALAHSIHLIASFRTRVFPFANGRALVDAGVGLADSEGWLGYLMLQKRQYAEADTLLTASYSKFRGAYGDPDARTQTMLRVPRESPRGTGPERPRPTPFACA